MGHPHLLRSAERAWDHVRVIVCGSRGWDQYERIAQRLDELPLDGCEPLTIVHGAARGTDSLAERWAVENGVLTEPHPANWARYGKSAGPRRNQQMLATGARLVLAFRCSGESRGTDHMIGLAQGWGVSVEVIGDTP